MLDYFFGGGVVAVSFALLDVTPAGRSSRTLSRRSHSLFSTPFSDEQFGFDVSLLGPVVVFVAGLFVVLEMLLESLRVVGFVEFVCVPDGRFASLPDAFVLFALFRAAGVGVLGDAEVAG